MPAGAISVMNDGSPLARRTPFGLMQVRMGLSAEGFGVKQS